ncbi:unnamed protein product [Diamesa hyperborea]
MDQISESDPSSITTLTIMRIDHIFDKTYKFVEDDIVHDIVTKVQPDYSVSFPPFKVIPDRFKVTNRVGSLTILISDSWDKKLQINKILAISMKTKLLSSNSKIVLISPYPLSAEMLFEMITSLNTIQFTNFIFAWEEAEELQIYGVKLFMDTNAIKMDPFENNLNFFYPDKIKDLRQYPMKVAVYDQYPRIHLSDEMYVGLDVPFLITFLNELNASLKFYHQAKGSLVKDLVQSIASRKYDMCVNTDFNSMTQDMNLIPLNEFDGFCALIPKEGPIPFYEFIFYPFEKEVWYVLAVTLGIGIFVWIISKRVNPNSSVGSFLFKLYGYFLGQGSSESSYLLSQKLILQLFIFAFLILGTCYQSLLVALILDPRYSYELKTFDEVKASNLTFAADNLFINNYLMVDSEFMPNKIVPFGTTNNQFNTANIPEVWSLKYGIIFKCSMAEIFLTSNENFNNDGSTKYYQVAEKIVTTMDAYPSSIYNPFEEKLKFIISSVFESGIKHYWKLQSTYVLYFNIFWLISLILSILGCSFLIIQVYDKWQENPVIVSVNEKSAPVWTIPFPAITICPENKFKRSLFNLSRIQFVDLNNSLSEQQINFQNALYPVCPFSYPIVSPTKLDFATELRKISIPFNEIFSKCVWRGAVTECETMFSEVLTDDGICYTFNMLDQNDLYTEIIDESMKYPKHNKSSSYWTMQDGYKTYDSQIYPQRGLRSGLKAGIEIHLIGRKIDIDYHCSGFSQGFKIALHSPNEIPRFSKQFTRIAFNNEVFINLVPEVLITSDVLKSYKPEVRKCYFDGEKTLKYFKSYTKSNCELECLANFTESICGCVKFGMPFDNKTEICMFYQQACSEETETTWLQQKLNQNLQQTNNKGPKLLNSKMSDCGCLQSCSSIKYTTETSQGSFLKNDLLKVKGYDEDQYSSVVTIYIKDDDFIALKRSEFYGWTDFLSNCGGLFGLFMGFSILSLVEIMYYFTLRWIVAKPENVQPFSSVEPEIICDSEVTISLIFEDITNLNSNNVNNLKQKINQ